MFFFKFTCRLLLSSLNYVSNFSEFCPLEKYVDISLSLFNKIIVNYEENLKLENAKKLIQIFNHTVLSVLKFSTKTRELDYIIDLFYHTMTS